MDVLNTLEIHLSIILFSTQAIFVLITVSVIIIRKRI